jgi:carbon starvation protein
MSCYDQCQHPGDHPVDRVVAVSVCFGGAINHASLALMLVTAYLMSEGRSAAFAFYPMIFMFITTVAALLYTSYNLLARVFTGAVKGEALIGNTLMGLIGFFLVIAALILGFEGVKAFNRYRVLRAHPAPAKA